ncbi:hypothetical protein K0040_01695 [Terrisporobacter petrolearius]|uniref:hypothetical protein n=1 Tax=Terrisporobacter petrolearius TaxID=1460447 RepID=UPI001D1653EF|nr:hypothetical protein [Terrisporobacter petrolearius]MCC3863027.1 hypothetical protein [Terrisporobacter petrolearius]
MKIIDTYSTKGDSIEILLRQIGATKITRVRGYLYFIKFKIDDLDITYTYNINHKNQYFLQRIEPYPLGKGIFDKEIEIVSFIQKDLSKFKKAKKLDNFNNFLKLNNAITSLTTDVENLFLNYDISDVNISQLEETLNAFSDKIEECKKNINNIE